jgi:acetoin utilization deacetylase AcuC-like enzyme
MSTGIVFSPECLTYSHYPETADRVLETVEYFRTMGMDDLTSPREYDESWVRFVHTPEYIDYVKSTAAMQVTGLEYEHVRLSANSCLTAGELLAEGDIQNGFVLNRPPGHHAYTDEGGGFCYFNNAAVLTRYLQKQGFAKVMIVDWDAHHGNGTEAIFYDDPSVLYVSIHQHPLYPGTGMVTDTGSGPGVGYTINIPVPPGTGHDTYMSIFREIIVPIGKAYKPDALVISAGQDSHKDDPLAQLRLCRVSYQMMTEQLVHGVCSKAIAVLEGGYHPLNVAHANYAIVSALSGKKNYDIAEFNVEPEFARMAVRDAKEVLSAYW